VEHVYGTAIKGFSVKLPPGQLKKLQDDPSVVLVEKDQFVQLIEPTKVTVKARPKPTPPAQTVPWGIGRVNGGVSGATGTAWVIDTGIDLDHPELNVDTSRSKTFVSSKSADDDNGHGSHVAGIIAARDNSIGVIGVAAGAKLVAVKVLTRSGSGTTSGVIAGVDYVAANAKSGDVANMSLGGVVSVLLDQAVLNASSNCVFALAAGNEGDDANNHSPARVDGDNIYTISAMDSADKFASWSNWGNPPVDYCEPGVSIYSCYKGGGYATMSGTSMAAPHAAGLLLLGSIKSDSKVTGDPDGNADPIGEH
jgi:subtilisin family serine protease